MENIVLTSYPYVKSTLTLLNNLLPTAYYKFYKQMTLQSTNRTVPLLKCLSTNALYLWHPLPTTKVRTSTVLSKWNYVLFITVGLHPNIPFNIS